MKQIVRYFCPLCERVLKDAFVLGTFTCVTHKCGNHGKIVMNPLVETVTF